MLHIYRQITSLRRVETFVIAKIRENAELYPFRDLELLERPKTNVIRRGRLKYLAQVPALVYRGEFEVIRRVLLRRDPDLMHIYFGNAGVHLLPLIERWDRPCVVSFDGMDVQRRETERGYEANLRKLLRLVPLVLVQSRSIAERLIELDCDPQKIRMGAAASETVVREFSQPRQIELLESAYFEAIEQWNKKSTEDKKGKA